MTPRLFVLAAAAVMAVAGSAGAAGYSSPAPSKAPATTSAAAADTLTAKEVNDAIPIDKITNPTRRLATAKVDDHAGHMIGWVESVLTGASGAPTAVQVDIGGDHIVSMDAKNLTYIPNRHILLTPMTKAEVQKLPAAKG